MFHPVGEDGSAKMHASLSGLQNCPPTHSSDRRIGLKKYKSKNLEELFILSTLTADALAFGRTLVWPNAQFLWL